MAVVARTLGALALCGAGSASFSFVSVGDWGGATINPGDYHDTNEHEVAKQMGITAADIDAKFVINTGDNFYYCGVQNITDEMFKADFEDVFTAKSLYVPWYGVLGNHDYAYSVEAQFKYKSPNNDRWQLPSQYYSKRILLGGTQYATFVFVDTNPCIASYRASDPKGWDPCSGEFGECKETADGECHFNEHILAQDCGVQFAWLKKTLAAIDDEDWVIVVGHHEADKIDVEDFTGALLASKARLYLNGHTHALKHYQIDGRRDVDFLTTGAGCMIRTKDQDVCHGATCLTDLAQHSASEVFYQTVSGFSTHTFSDDFSTLTTKVVDTSGKVIHSFVTSKAGPTPGPGPAPAPGPGPSPAPPAPGPAQGSCKEYGCGRYAPKQQCQCNRYCDEHKDCCGDFEQVCSGPAPAPPSIVV